MRCVRLLRLVLPVLVVTLALATAHLAAAPAARASVRSEVSFHRGVAAYGEGRYFEAEREFEAVLEDDPENAEALAYLGLIAQGQGEVDDAVARFEAVLAIDPADVDVRLRLAEVLLEANRNVDADVQLATVRARRPGDPVGLHYSGVAAYRLGRYVEAKGYFERALQLDPELELQSRYYVGLCETALREPERAVGAFAAVADLSPTHPLARSASELSGEMSGTVPRRFNLRASVGFEYDSNPLAIGDAEVIAANFNKSDDVRGVFRWGGSYALVEGPVRWLVGYDGYYNEQRDEPTVEQQVHLVWTGVSTTVDTVRIGVRGDFSWNAIESDNQFFLLYRLLPTVSIPTGDWGFNRIYYEFQYIDFDNTGIFDESITGPAAGAGFDEREFDRDGPRNTLGFDQFVLLDGILSELRGGAAFTTYNPQGDEFEHLGFEVSAGFALQLLEPLEFRGLYRFQYRFYSEDSLTTDDDDEREDQDHRVILDLSYAFNRYVEASVFGRLTFNESNTGVFDFDRQIGGVNLTVSY